MRSASPQHRARPLRVRRAGDDVIPQVHQLLAGALGSRWPSRPSKALLRPRASPGTSGLPEEGMNEGRNGYALRQRRPEVGVEGRRRCPCWRSTHCEAKRLLAHGEHVRRGAAVQPARGAEERVVEVSGGDEALVGPVSADGVAKNDRLPASSRATNDSPGGPAAAQGTDGSRCPRPSASGRTGSRTHRRPPRPRSDPRGGAPGARLTATLAGAPPEWRSK